MPRLILLLAGFILSGAVKKILVGAGLGLVSMTVIQTLFDTYFDRVLHYSTYGFDSTVIQLLGLAKIDACLSIIFGAVFARVAVNAMSLALSKSV